MQHLEVSGAVRHIYIYVIRRLKVNVAKVQTSTYLIKHANMQAYGGVDVHFHAILISGTLSNGV